MSLSNKKILISGCGLSWSQQTKKTWVNVLKIAGANVLDVGGPAVSNQWIINRVIDHLLHHSDVDHVVVQLTSLGKLDVEVDAERMIELVDHDTLRNFTIQGVWPSSHSEDHPAKQMWTRWLFSPGLEMQDLTNKLALLGHWCMTNQIRLTVFQGYQLPWTNDQKLILQSIVDTAAEPAADFYRDSDFYQWHDHAKQNTVPCLEYQIDVACRVAQHIDDQLSHLVRQVREQYFSKYHPA